MRDRPLPGTPGEAAGHRAELIPAQYVKLYRRRGKTDRIDTEAVLEAHRCAGIHPIPVRSVEQQQLRQRHRVGEQWKRTRTQRINGPRGFVRELGYAIPLGARVDQRRARAILDDGTIPGGLQTLFTRLLEEIATLEAFFTSVERQWVALTADNGDVHRLQAAAGIGLLTSTAMVASAGSPHHLPDGRRFASWIGLTPRECSSGNPRSPGRISKQGDGYLCMLLTHGAHAVLARAKQLRRAGKPLSRLQQWACQLEQRVGHNKAACALANKLARVCRAVWKHERDFGPYHAPV